MNPAPKPKRRKPLKPKACRVCSRQFQPTSSTQIVCSVNCAIQRNLATKAKARKVQKKADMERLKTLGTHHKETQAIFNRFIRLRDQGLPCISCGLSTGAQRQAGHYRSVGGHPELRYDPDNVHSQCCACNDWLSGNLINYRIGLLAKIGPERVERLEGPQEKRQYRVDELKAIQAEYKAKAKELIREGKQ